jgi:hypothetical protein
MPRKQATVNESSAAAAPARAAKPKAPRVKSAKHTKTVPVESSAAHETNAAIETLPSAVLDSTPNGLQVEAAVEQIESPLFVSASAAATAPSVNGDPREEIARIAYGYWQARGCVGGDPIEDWVRAENEYRQRIG